MYFVHPQLKLNNIFKAALSLALPLNREKLIKQLSNYFPNKQFVFTDMGRTAFRVIVEKMNLQNSEMFMPAYICNIFYPILKRYNIKPIFLDIDLKTFHIKINDIKDKITPNTKSILVCHTYGLPFDVDALRAKLQGLYPWNSRGTTPIIPVIIEDCAHAFPLGNSGDISFFSLYKQFPALRGGMLVCPKDWEMQLPRTNFNFRDLLSFLNYFWPFAFFFKKFGSEYAKTHLREEKLSEAGSIAAASLKLFSNFFNDVRESLEKRKKLALALQSELKGLGFEVQEPSDNIFCYLSAMVPDNLADKRDDIVRQLKKYYVFCTRIWNEKYAIILDKEVQEDYQINLADFPNTLQAAKRVINFPLQNYYTQKDIEKMARAIKKVLSNL